MAYLALRPIELEKQNAELQKQNEELRDFHLFNLGLEKDKLQKQNTKLQKMLIDALDMAKYFSQIANKGII